MTPQSPFDVSDEIQVALGLGAAVVALESAVVTHGLPYPANLGGAPRRERRARGHGAGPAAGAPAGEPSAELDELSRRPLVLVCSGAKAICDVGATLEALETRGVTVIGYRTVRFPYFYVADSGHPVPWSADSVAEIAAISRAKERLGDMSALLVANPPPEQWALPADDVAGGVGRAGARAATPGTRGGGR